MFQNIHHIASSLNQLSSQIMGEVHYTQHINNQSSADQIIHTIQSITKQINLKDASIINSYENMIHLLDSCSLMSKVCKTSDRQLFFKAFAYFNQSLTHLVTTLHEYPINTQFFEKKSNLQNRHLNILQQTEQYSLESSILQNSIEAQHKNLVVDNMQLIRKNQQLQMALISSQKELVQSQIKIMNLINDQKQPNNFTTSYFTRELEKAHAEIQSMNNQFTFQIKKYNQVFKSMEKQIRYLQQNSFRGNDEQIIEQLETQIIKLRQQRERDQMIISELRDHLGRYKSHMKSQNRYY